MVIEVLQFQKIQASCFLLVDDVIYVAGRGQICTLREKQTAVTTVSLVV